MPRYKLVYFNARGRAEPARMLFHLKGQTFEDARFRYEDWPNLKTDKTLFPMGQAPILMVDDKLIPQSRAIWRYLAQEFGYMGDDALETADIDVVIETIYDIQMKMVPLYAHLQDQVKTVELMTAFKETTSKPYFDYLVQVLKKGEGKYFVNNKLSLADLVVFSVLDMMIDSKYTIEGVLDPYPELESFYRTFKEESPLKSYLKIRPITHS